MKQVGSLVCLMLACTLASGEEWFLRVDSGGQQIEGLPLSWDQQEFFLLERDGRIRKYDMELAKRGRKVRAPFQPMDAVKMRAQLGTEFGRQFEVTSTGNYLVLHPRGQSDKWPHRFEQLYREMLVYFRTRGLPVGKPHFPMVAMVFPNQREFAEYMIAEGYGYSRGLLGLYSHLSNRIYLYDTSAGGTLHADWRDNAATIVHEAAHQTAFNTGIHQRMSGCPKWVIEGLGCLFEAPGIYDASRHREKFERIHHKRLQQYQQIFPNGLPKRAVEAIVSSDDLFRASPGHAYTLSWALTFMLSESDTSRYAEFVRRTSMYEPFAEVTAARRIRDFQRVFGQDFEMIQTRLHRYMMEL